MDVTFQLSEDDVRHGLLAWRNIYAWRHWSRRIASFLVVAAIGFSIVCAFVWTKSLQSRLLIIWISLGCGALWFILRWANPHAIANSTLRTTPTLRDQITLAASESGLRLHSATFDAQTSWSAYVAWGEGNQVFVILSHPQSFVTIPKRAFSAEQQQEFREILRRNVGRN